jgi:DNA-binding response OmpR family regulator
MTITPAPFSGRDRAGPGYSFALREYGLDAVDVSTEADLERMAADPPALALIDLATMSALELGRCSRRCAELRIPAIALVPTDRLTELDTAPELADFVVVPPGSGELLARAKRVLRQAQGSESEDLVRVGDLTINTATYEVSVGGQRVNLRFKEYELLLLMAKSPGRVYTREALLNSIWGYDYLGGTRTVDVHVRRLRSKTEDADHLFIETVWNVGYRFKAI